MVQEMSLGLREPCQSGRPKTTDSEVVLEALEANPVSTNWSVLAKLGISQFSMLCYLHDFGKSIQSCQIVPHITKTLQNYWLHHHYHVVPQARISLTLSCHFASGRSSGSHPVSSHSCWMYVCAGCPAFAWPYVGVHWSTSLMSLFLLLQQCPACLVRLTWIVFMMGGR